MALVFETRLQYRGQDRRTTSGGQHYSIAFINHIWGLPLRSKITFPIFVIFSLFIILIYRQIEFISNKFFMPIWHKYIHKFNKNIEFLYNFFIIIIIIWVYFKNEWLNCRERITRRRQTSRRKWAQGMFTRFPKMWWWQRWRMPRVKYSDG